MAWASYGHPATRSEDHHRLMLRERRDTIAHNYPYTSIDCMCVYYV